MSEIISQAELRKEIFSLIHSDQKVPLTKIADFSYLERDLGITGSNADEFIKNFCNKYGIDFSRIDLTKHFYGKGLSSFKFNRLMPGLILLLAVLISHLNGMSLYVAGLGFLFILVMYYWKFNREPVFPIRVCDLIDIASEKKWPARWQIEDKSRII